ncbi:SET [Cordylochernes scorpioides]|uniref:SET n=1 Tax=Cordylochernes scorpioides TaxID=51811 RepID=A0ABY6LEI0_9ARAC|nr:SET [Cordylochernes scorpioides]
MSTSGSTPKKVRKVEGSVGEAEENRDFDSETQSALEAIDAVQNDIDQLNEKASEQILKVEQKFNKERKPFFEKRNELIGKIPCFWLTTFRNHPQISTILTEEEQDCLQHLTKLEVEEFEDIKSGYRIKFHFSEDNPYFSNKVLVKEFHLAQTGDPASHSTPIEWNAGKNLLQAQNNSENQGRKRSRQAGRTFFSWFTDHGDASADDIAEVIKDDMWPNPLQYFLVPDVENGMEDSEDDEVDDSVVVVEEEEEEEFPESEEDGAAE